MSIKSIRVYGPAGEFLEDESYQVGQDMGEAWGKVTSLTPRDVTTEPYCCQQYIEVWCGDKLHSEFPKHNLAAIYYDGTTPTF